MSDAAYPPICGSCEALRAELEWRTSLQVLNYTNWQMAQNRIMELESLVRQIDQCIPHSTQQDDLLEELEELCQP